MSSSALAGAAYAAGEKLFSEYEQRYKDYTDKKPEVLYSEILLPPNAQEKFYDRETLWNSAESVETSYNSQLARNIVAALPNEIPKEQLPELVREFCEEQFVKKGMCCDLSIHDKLNSFNQSPNKNSGLIKCQKIVYQVRNSQTKQYV